MSGRMDEIQQLNSTIESKQSEIANLEDLAQKLLKQDERSQKQRVRFEARLSELEFALHNTRTQQYVQTPRN